MYRASEKTADEYKEDNTVNPALLWEMIKVKVREKSISYAASKNVATKKREIQLERDITALESQPEASTSFFEKKAYDLAF